MDDLHEEIREAAAVRGRMPAVRILRQRLPTLSPSQALEYVSALLQADAPAHLVAVAVEHLIEPMNPVLAVQTIRQENSIRPEPRSDDAVCGGSAEKGRREPTGR